MASYTITRNLTNVSSNTIKLRVSPDTGYTLPNTIEVLNGTLDSWNPLNGELILSNITDTTTVNIVATEQETNYFSIKVDYDDPNIGTESEISNAYIGLARYENNNITTKAIFDGTLEYSKDKLTWTSLNKTGEQLISVTNGETVYFRGKNNTHIGPDAYGSTNQTFRMLIPNIETTNPMNVIRKITVSGDILTLLNYENYPTWFSGAVFAEMFNYMRNTNGTPSLSNFRYCSTNEIDASNLVLPDFTNDACYGMMFRNNNIVHMPKLPALTVWNDAYRAMFSGTTELRNVSALPATKVYDYGYYSMFNNVTRMDKLPEIAATVLNGYGPYGFMFNGVSDTGISTVDTDVLEPWYLSGSPVTLEESTNTTISMFTDANFSDKISTDLNNSGPAVLYVNPNIRTIAKLEDL